MLIFDTFGVLSLYAVFTLSQKSALLERPAWDSATLHPRLLISPPFGFSRRAAYAKTVFAHFSGFFRREERKSEQGEMSRE
jgi:hypothetical protein